MKRLVFASCLWAFAGCIPSIGSDCDLQLAKTVYYNSAGLPHYSGQALLNAYCASCHNDPGTNGVPAGLEMSLSLVREGGSQDDVDDDARELRAHQAIVHRNRDIVYQQVANGSMPPRNFARETSVWTDAAGDPLPPIDSAEAQGLLANWLACGSPVVERTTPGAASCTRNSDCAVSRQCDTGTGLCLGVGFVEPKRGGSIDCETLTPTFAYIHTCYLQTQCSACHGIAPGMSNFAIPTDIGEAYTMLTTTGPSAQSTECGDFGMNYVVANSPDESLLYQKLREEGPTCGDSMRLYAPVDAAENADVILQWVMAGAPGP